MASEDTTNAPAPPPPSRLSGWKEIATYFGRGVRTVQRWEKDVGLPVHRIGTGVAEVVYALVPELERWQQSAAANKAAREPADVNGAHNDLEHALTPSLEQRSDATVRPRIWRRTTWWIASGSVVVIVVLATLTWDRLAHPAVAGQPASSKVANNALTILDADGRFLWQHRFDFRLEDPYKPRNAYGWEPIQFADLDGDGNVEVLFVSEPVRPSSRGLFCFNHDGTLRFQHQPQYQVKFGPLDAGPPWRAAFVRVEGTLDHAHTLWFVSFHLSEFPTVVEKLDAQGRVGGTYWSYGQVRTVTEAEIGGRRLVLIGGTNNEFKGGSLAILDARHPDATSPAVNPHYQCASCPLPTPIAFMVFPRLDTALAAGSHANVNSISVDAAGHITVAVQQGPNPAGSSEDDAALVSSVYTLDGSFRVIKAELGEFYATIHRRYEEKALLDHPFSTEHDARFLWPVRRWHESSFLEVASLESRDHR